MKEHIQVHLNGFGFLMAPGGSAPGTFLLPKALSNIAVTGLSKSLQFTHATARVGTQSAEFVLAHDAGQLSVALRLAMIGPIRDAYPIAEVLYLDDSLFVRSAETVRIVDGPTTVAAVATVAVDRVAAAWDDSDPLVVGAGDGSWTTRPFHNGASWVVDVAPDDLQ